MLDHYQKGDNRSCSDSVDSPKKIKTWQWHRLETDENPGGQVPKEGVAVDKECGKLKGKRVSGGEHGEYPKIEWKPKKWGVAEVRRGKDRSGWFTFDQWERLQPDPGYPRKKDWVDGRILEMAVIHRSWVWAIRTPGKIFEAEWEGRRHYRKKLKEIQWESRKKTYGRYVKGSPYTRVRGGMRGGWEPGFLSLILGVRLTAEKEGRVYELDGHEPEK
ncbi:hypothetical protein B0H16DRAFT_1459914 [Mycena metata]|uniref:Uncharacterized protein n=1 Tax=Mycena metata TaxID=1033252 RepID=A0AAD7IX11_9AGAR|nr:hypothetical protein B0H16DRAFT_1459914 [Mycena metata]